MADSGVDYSYRYDVRDQNGNPAAKIVHEHPELGPAPSYEPCNLPPGKSTTSGALLSRIYRFDEPGEYTIQVSRPDLTDPKRGLVKSNTITITMVPAEDLPPPKQQEDSATPNPSTTESPRESSMPDAAGSVADAGERGNGNEKAGVKAKTSFASVIPNAEKPAPTFTLSIEEDKEATRMNPSLHRVIVKHTNISMGDDLDRFHKEAKGPYNMIVLRDGVPVAETPAMWELRRYRKADTEHAPANPRVLRPGQSWTDTLDVSDYYDMTQPGTYQITVTRESLPWDPVYSTLVKSNTITVVVPPQAGAPNRAALQKPKPRFALTISEPKSEDNPDESPRGVIQVGIENISGSVIREYKCWPLLGMYNFYVSRDGEPLEGNDELRSLQKSRAALNCPGNESLIEINPGETDLEEANIPLCAFFDIEKPGWYQAYVTRETYPWNPAKSVLVTSNVISFYVPAPTAGAAPPTDIPQ